MVRMGTRMGIRDGDGDGDGDSVVMVIVMVIPEYGCSDIAYRQSAESNAIPARNKRGFALQRYNHSMEDKARDIIGSHRRLANDLGERTSRSYYSLEPIHAILLVKTRTHTFRHTHIHTYTPHFYLLLHAASRYWPKQSWHCKTY